MPPVTPETSPRLAQVRELPAGDKIIGFYLLTKLELKPKRAGGNYLELRLQDSTGHLGAKMWEEFEEFASVAKPGDIIKIEGVVDRYKEVPGLVIARIRHATEEEAGDRSDFLPHSPVSSEKAHEMLFQTIESLQNVHLRTLMESVFGDAGFLSGFLRTPGGKLWHHATIGGLAEHTIALATLTDRISSIYPQLQRDLIVSGALLHDVGKVFELSTEIGIEYTIEGRLLGHITQGTLFLDRKIAVIDGFPAELRQQLLHLILSHQGDGTMGSPVKPMTCEAIALHLCDELDSKLNAFEGVRTSTPEGRDLSDYVKLMDRFFYFKGVDEQEETGDGKTTD